jgi:arylsulfatase/arylsulfatase A
MRKGHLFIGLTIITALGFNSCKEATKSPIQEKPNVIVFLADDVGYGDLSCHGNPYVKTPVLDKFAGEGVEMENFYVAPACAPTRAGLMTGRYHYRTKTLDVGITSTMSTDEITLAEILKNYGYSTGIFGKWHLGDHYPNRPMDQGFDKAVWHFATNILDDYPPGNSYYDPVLMDNSESRKFKGYCMDVYTDEAIHFMQESIKGEKPFFVYMPSTLAHVPLDIKDSEIQLFLDKGVAYETARVYGMIKSIDKNFGRLINTLEELEIRDNTIIMFFSDNGPNAVTKYRYQAGLKGQKGSVYEGGIKVPFLFQWKGKNLNPRKVKPFGSYIDVLPTILDAASIERPPGYRIDGKSLMPLIEDKNSDWSDRNLIIQWLYTGANKPKKYERFMLRNNEYKLVSETLAGRSGHRLRRHYEWCEENGYVNYQITDKINYELYAINDDPGERHNLAKQKPEVVESMLKQYELWYDDVLSDRGVDVLPLKFNSNKEDSFVLISNWWVRKALSWDIAVETPGEYKIKLVWGNVSQPELYEKHVIGNADLRKITNIVKPETANLKVGDKVYTKKISGPAGEVDFGPIDIPAGYVNIRSWINTQETQLSLTTLIGTGPIDLAY